MPKSIVLASALSGIMITFSAHAGDLTVRDAIREYKAENPVSLGYINGLVKGAVVHLSHSK